MALHLNKLKFPSPNDGEIVPVILEMRMYKQQTTDKFFSEKLTSFFLES